MTAAQRTLLGIALLGAAGLLARPAAADASVVGISDRHTFGRWAWGDLPRLTIGVGTSLHVASFEGATLYGGTKGAPVTGPSGALDGTSIVATTIDIRPRFFLAGPLYFGPTFMFGPGFRRGTPTAPTTVHADRAGFFFEGGGVLGLAARPWRGPINVYAEVLGGVRVASLTVHDDAPGLDAAHSSYAAQIVQGTVAPRVGLDVWTSPYGTFGGWVGVDVLHRSAWSTGLALTLHLAPFDSGPS